MQYPLRWTILETVVDHCRRDGYVAVESVRVRGGQGADILPIAAEAVLLREVMSLAARCENCVPGVLKNRLSLDCPADGSSSLCIIGYVMAFIDMDVAENPKGRSTEYIA
jgi:Zn finger protein HypA/HybF involved in hydrogenase expression